MFEATPSHTEWADALRRAASDLAQGRVREAEVILETPQDIIKGNADGPLAVPGKPDESYLFQVSSHLEEPEMPPLKNKVSANPLNPQQLGLIKLWIQQGVKGEVRNAIPINWHPIQTTINNPIGSM